MNINKIRIILISILIMVNYSNIVLAETKQLNPLFNNVLVDFGSKSEIPVYLPTLISLQDFMKSPNNPIAISRLDQNGYSVELYYSHETSGATYAGSISGSHITDISMPNTMKTKLANGETAIFRPISCGGSCSPVNLWWHHAGYQYSIQLKLPSKTSKTEQLNKVVEMANSMVLYK